MQLASLYLIDNHTVVRRGICKLLETQTAFTVLGEASSAETALTEIPGLQPDIVLLELCLPGVTGIETVRRLQRQSPRSRVVALSVHDSKEHLQAFMAAGGRAYVPKSASAEQLFDALAAVSRGEYYAPARLLADLARGLSEPDFRTYVRLTAREREVVSFIAEGCTYKEIAKTLGVGEKSVATYRERAANKLGLANRAELVRWVLEQRQVAVGGVF